MAAPDLIALIDYLARGLVDNQDEVRVELVEERNANVYEIVEVKLPQGRVDWTDTEVDQSLEVPLRLTPGGLVT